MTLFSKGYSRIGLLILPNYKISPNHLQEGYQLQPSLIVILPIRLFAFSAQVGYLTYTCGIFVLGTQKSGENLSFAYIIPTQIKYIQKMYNLLLSNHHICSAFLWLIFTFPYPTDQLFFLRQILSISYTLGCRRAPILCQKLEGRLQLAALLNSISFNIIRRLQYL